METKIVWIRSEIITARRRPRPVGKERKLIRNTLFCEKLCFDSWVPRVLLYFSPEPDPSVALVHASISLARPVIDEISRSQLEGPCRDSSGTHDGFPWSSLLLLSKIFPEVHDRLAG